MKYIILMIVLITITFSCNNQKQNIDQQFIDAILNEEVDSQMIIFLKSEDKENVGYTTVSILQKTYEADNRFKTHDKRKFISDALSGKIVFDCDDIIRCFIINDTIKDFYIENSFSTFFNTYCTLDSKDEYIIKNNLSFNAELSIIYFLYQNQFYTTQDDVSGYYYTRSFKTLYKQIEGSKKEMLLLEKELDLNN